MLIAGFGDTVAGMYTFPTAMMADTWRVTLPGATVAVPLADGVLDVRGNSRNRRAALTIGKAFVLAAQPLTFTATGLVTTTAGSPTVKGTSTLFLSEVVAGEGVEIDGYHYTVVAVATNLSLTISPPALSTTSIRLPMTVIQFAPRWAALDTLLDALRAATIGRGRSKVWALERGGTYRWTWAKVTRLRAPDRVGQINHCPIDLQIRLEAPIWYSENAHTGALTSGLNALTNAGNVATPVTVRLTAATAPCTAFEFRNADGVNRVAFAGSVAVGQVFTIDSANRAALNNGVGDYDAVTITGTGAYLSLPAGTSGLNWQSSTGGSPTATYEYYDAWVM